MRSDHSYRQAVLWVYAAGWHASHCEWAAALACKAWVTYIKRGWLVAEVAK